MPEKSITENKEEPFNSKANIPKVETNIPKHDIPEQGQDNRDYKSEYYALLDWMDNVLFNMQLAFRNVKAMGLEQYKIMQRGQIQP